MRIFITGDSHTGALKRGADELLANAEVPGGHTIEVLPLGAGSSLLKPFFEVVGSVLKITDENCNYWVKQIPLLRSVDEPDVYAISAPLHLQPIILHPFFSKHLPAPIASSPTLASTSLIRSITLNRKRFALEMVLALKRININVLVVEPPRTFSHHPALANRNLEVVKFLENECRSIVKKVLNSHAIPIAELPENSFDSNGLMLDKFRHEDASDRHHGNALYGQMMIKQIIDASHSTV